MGQEGERGEVGLGDGALDRQTGRNSQQLVSSPTGLPSAGERAHLVGMLLRPLGFSLQGRKKKKDEVSSVFVHVLTLRQRLNCPLTQPGWGPTEKAKLTHHLAASQVCVCVERLI